MRDEKNWVVGSSQSHGTHVSALDGVNVAWCGCNGGMNSDEAYSNAVLIAAAPELLKYLRYIVTWLNAPKPSVKTLDEQMDFLDATRRHQYRVAAAHKLITRIDAAFNKGQPRATRRKTNFK